MQVNPHKLGLAIGALLGLIHLTWSLLVATGLAQTYMDWIFKLHFITPVYQVGPFDLMTAITLVAVTAILGYIIGWVGANVWNYVAKKK